MGLEGVQGPPGSQVFWLISLKSQCIKSRPKGPPTLFNMTTHPKGNTAYNANCLPLFG